MIVQKQSNGTWMAAGKGTLRPIVVEGETRPAAILQFAEAVHQQEAEEYSFVQSMSHLADVESGAGAYGKDYG